MSSTVLLPHNRTIAAFETEGRCCLWPLMGSHTRMQPTACFHKERYILHQTASCEGLLRRLLVTYTSILWCGKMILLPTNRQCALPECSSWQVHDLPVYLQHWAYWWDASFCVSGHPHHPRFPTMGPLALHPWPAPHHHCMWRYHCLL